MLNYSITRIKEKHPKQSKRHYQNKTKQKKRQNKTKKEKKITKFALNDD